MPRRSAPHATAFGQLATHFQKRRPAILRAWRAATTADPGQTTARHLRPGEFRDHIPRVLDAFAARLRALPATTPAGTPKTARAAASANQVRTDERGHGLHRWQEGYSLREVTREWGHLHLCLIRELERYARTYPERLTPARLTAARLELAALVNDGVGESTEQYAHLDREEAASHARDLCRVLDELQDLGRRRAQLLHQAAHDLGSDVQAANLTALVLRSPDLPESAREESLSLLQQSVESLRGTLAEVMDLARLEAGQEQRVDARFDVAEVLGVLAASLRPLAEGRELTLGVTGPAPLMVQGDAVKVRRIAQNLLTNALRYTVRGGVTLRWQTEGEQRWSLTVTDTGPGLARGSHAPPILAGMRAATESAREAEGTMTAGELKGVPAPPPPAHPSAPAEAPVPASDGPRGEGIGLSIVKRLCELLDASLEVASSSGGTVFRVVLPRHELAKS